MVPALAEVTKKLREVFPEKQAQVLVELVELANQLVKASDFVELKQVVKELAEAQKRTEKRVEELAEAQKQSEVRLTRLEATVQELAEAQKRTERRMEELAQAQAELAQAQQRTEAALQKLAEEHLETRRQLGGLAMTVGYTLENEAYKALPALLKRDYGLAVQGRLKRSYVPLADGEYLEVNVLGDGVLQGRPVKIVGESKAQLSQNDVDRFIRRKLRLLREVFPDLFPVLITHMVTAPQVEEYARSKGIALYYSYDF
ncbi:MAG: chordopoxvirus fusion protein [Clostridia bacterium]|nr:chordopoxvirus fusion protein [Clostridia bacterium]MDH7573180.1 chordopoxvirus fusion protein [Clostridia bacterium]